MKRLMYLATLALVGCSSLPSAWYQGGTAHFPTAQQILAVCNAEIAAGTPSAKAPDCQAYYILQHLCNAQAMANVVNPVALPVAATVNPIAGSLLQTTATLNTSVCAAQGFYSASTAVVVAPTATPSPSK